MAEETWAGADVEISEDTLKRWRDEMELAVTKEAEARAAEAEAAARELLEQRKRRDLCACWAGGVSRRAAG